MSSQKKHARVAVIGMGDMGQTHAAAYLSNPSTELVAVVDTRPGVAEAFAAEHGTPRSYVSADGLFADVAARTLTLDGISICTPNSTHAPLAIAALQHRVNVLCEKPVADTVEAAEAIERAALASTAEIMFGFLYRYHPETQQRILEAQERIGRLVRGEISVMRRDGRPDRPAFTNRGLTGGGPLVDLGCHVLAPICDLIGGAVPTWAAGATLPRRIAGGADVENFAFGTFGFGRGNERVMPGAQLSVRASWVTHLPDGAPDERWTIALSGTDGAIEFDLPIGAGPAQAGYDAEIDAFAKRITGARAWGDDLENGLWVQRRVDELYRSAEEGGAPLPRTLS